ncbi:transglutaminase-like cysteine peptidase [Actibacterium pelagium]|uniref:Transglutaminase n=1 Tax=Actibacterium pelagium TaxID=2029103 RepID=A0A917AKT8_9RHOB|nr:transglutaminase-like cysteine peptidase [Actibacterium pelagium]GGE57762.1 hypothetical protein GCM10011517_26960 [Actibacterium pelagium]
MISLRTIQSLATAGIMALSVLGGSTGEVQANAGAFLSSKFAAPTPKAAKDMCTRYSWACSQSGDRAALTSRDMKVIDAVNKQVNRKVRPVSDSAQYRREDLWTLPSRRGGDCEDYALAKKLELIKAGIAPERLLIAKVLDRKRQGHAVLVVRTDQGDMVLDNLTNRIKTWDDTRYTFLVMQDPKAPSSWIGVMQRGR